MARKAFFIASNGPQNYRLKYAEKDAEDFARCLQTMRYGFEVFWPKKKPKSEIFDQFEDTILSCTEEDTFICYFAGHGHLQKGKLHLVVEENEDLDKGSLRFSNLAEEIEEKCRAKNKLIILDCCHAGAANTRSIPPKFEDVIPENNYVVIAASDRMSTIREYPELEGSFLTQKICEGLDREFYQVDKDKDDKISLDDLVTWLKECNIKYNINKKEAERAPLPYLKNGHLKGSFYLTQDSFPWLPQYLSTTFGTELAILPIRPRQGKILCVSNSPVTNREYKLFVETTNRSKPQGRCLPPDKKPNKDNWQEGFEPWNNSDFNDPEQPVVCVSYSDAQAYCNWFNNDCRKDASEGKAFLPPVQLWNFAAYGIETSFDDYVNQKVWFEKDIHHKSFAPITVDKAKLRTNSFGISDLFGNVWEWSPGQLTIEDFCGMKSEFIHPPFLKGGGFLDDFSTSWFKPHLRSSILNPADPFTFRSFDLGFRTAFIMPLDTVSKTTQDRLSYCPAGTEDFWSTILLHCYLN